MPNSTGHINEKEIRLALDRLWRQKEKLQAAKDMKDAAIKEIELLEMELNWLGYDNN
jgi:hypothetical protein